jgi:FixJ family two-component response regulator
MKAGAFDWLETPYEKDELLAAVASAMANIQQTTSEQREKESALRRIAGMSARERQVFDGLLAGGTNKTIGKQPGISPARWKCIAPASWSDSVPAPCPKPC